MFVFWDTVIKPVLDIIKPKALVEIGCEKGDNTKNLLEYCSQNGAVLHAIDPLPQFNAEAWKEQYGPHFVFYPCLSLNALPLVPEMDLVLIDGDHNWYTVYNELKLIEKHVQEKKSRFPLLMVHDTGWPYGRRDMYYNPENIPETYLKPYKKMGISPETPELLENKGINDHLCNAIHENEWQSGVLTAVEDFLKETTFSIEIFSIPAYHGMSIVYPLEFKKNGSFLKLLEGFASSEYLLEILNQVETSRIGLRVEKEDLERVIKQKNIEYKSIREDLKSNEKEAINLRRDLQKEKSEKEKYKLSLEQAKDEIISIKTDLRDQRSKIKEQANDLAKLNKWLFSLQEHHRALLKSRRWKIGHTLTSILNKVLFRKQDSLVTSKIDKVFSQFNSWHKKKGLEDKGIDKDLKKLMGWIAELEKRIKTLLSSRRWKMGNLVGNITSFRFGRKGEPLPVRELNSIFRTFDKWSPFQERKDHDIEMLSEWIEQIKDNYKKLLKSRRWKMGNKIIMVLSRFTFRKSGPVNTQKIDDVFNDYFDWKQTKSNIDYQDDLLKTSLLGTITVSPEEAVGEPYELLPPLK